MIKNQTGSVSAAFTNSYDQANRLERLDYPVNGAGMSMAAERLIYDDFGQGVQAITGGRVVNAVFDPLGQMTQRTWSGSDCRRPP